MSVVLVHTERRVTTLTLNRPDKRNALSAALVSDLLKALEAAAADPDTRVVVLTGAGSVFSAGADLAALEALQTATPMDNLADSQHLAQLFEAIARHPKPIIAKVNGHAIAGGCGLATVCDLAIASEGAKLGFTEVRIGFVPAIVMVFVLRRVGEMAARHLFLRGHLVQADEAARLGLLTQVVSVEALDETVDALAQEIATRTSGSAVALTKRLLLSVPSLGLREGLDAAIHANAFARGTEDCQAGIAAFLHKTRPPWSEPSSERSRGT
ncbi:MAG: enoyl-CoA hydratase-related protein [Bacteroidota bacterium]